MEVKEKNRSEEYDTIFSELCYNSVLLTKLQKLYGSSLKSIYGEYEKILNEYTSMSLFTGDFVCFYPRLKYRKAKISFDDDIGVFISKGNSYCEYRPMLWNVSKNNTYVLNRSLKINAEDYDILPDSLHHFETFEEKIRFSKEPMYQELKRHYDGGILLRRLQKK